MRVIAHWDGKLPKTCAFLKSDLPALSNFAAGTAERKIWDSFVDVSGLGQAAITAVTANDSPPLLWFLPLELRTAGIFDPDVPGRVSLSSDIARKFEALPNDPEAQLFMRVAALHEMCHWAWRQQNLPDPDIAGENFEKEAGVHPSFAWIDGGAVSPAPMASANPHDLIVNSSDIDARVKSLRDAEVSGFPVPPSPDFFDGSDVAIGMPRGLRNNNPGNIRIGDDWRGLSERTRMTDFQKQETAFCVFNEPEWGLRAMARILRRYQDDHGLKTPHDIIARWAPASDNNDVASYASAVASALGVGTAEAIELHDETTLAKLMKAIARHENGQLPPYSDNQYGAAIRLL